MNEKVKKILNISTKVLTWIVVAFTVCMMVFTIVTVATVDKNERSILGFKFYIVRTDSMSKSENNADMKVHFNAGDIIIVKNLKDKTTLEKGDIISFVSMDKESYGETITHMIYDVRYTSDNKVIGYVTFGTNTGDIDDTLVQPEYVLGQYTGKLPGLGHFFAFVKSTPGYIICILVPFLLLIFYNGANVIVLFRKYKKEQSDAIAAEKAQIEQERAETQRMMAELLELKAQLAKNGGEQSTPTDENTAKEDSSAAEASDESNESEKSETDNSSDET